MALTSCILGFLTSIYWVHKGLDTVFGVFSVSRRYSGPSTRRFVHRPKEVIVRGGRSVDEIKKKISVRFPDSTLDERRIFDELLKRYRY